MRVALVNEWLTPENVVWAAAAASFLLLLLSGPLSRVAASPRRDGAVRLVKVCVAIFVPLLALFPALILFTGEEVPGAACSIYLLFFSLFCYYMGRGAGRARGRSEISDRVGLDLFDSVEEAADRLYESRQRFATRGEVEKSIVSLAAAAKSGSAADVDAATEVLDVAVEEV